MILCILGNRSEKILLLLDKNNCFVLNKKSDFFKTKHIKNKYNLILTDGFGKISVIALFSQLILQKPVISRTRGNFFQELESSILNTNSVLMKLRLFFRKKIAYIHLRKSEVIICNSKYTYDIYRTYFPNNKIEIIYNPYSFKKKPRKTLSPCKNVITLLSITNFNIKDKASPLIHAIKHWITLDFLYENNFEWVIYGKGKYLSELQQYLDNNVELKSKIKLKGFVDDLNNAYYQSDIFVHISNLDAFPNVTLEAMMYEKPLIINAGSCGTVEQVEHDVNGFIINEKEDFIKSLKKYMNSDIRSKHGREGKKIVEKKFTVEKQKEKLKLILEKYL